jgi:pimeloyl-ACP methyl ester carboxylesterase
MNTLNPTIISRPLQTAANTTPLIKADDWFRGGNRVTYDRLSQEISTSPPDGKQQNNIGVFKMIKPDSDAEKDTPWASFLPGWPDGSFGWSKTNYQLSGAHIGHRLFFDYVGHGESDKPVDYPYSTDERADMVVALWKAQDIRSTFVITFDYSSIVALELLSRQQDRLDAGEQLTTRIIGVIFINGGHYADGHTHPWYTTPILKTRLGIMATWMAPRSNLIFKELVKPLWSKDFKVPKEELIELFEVINRRSGTHVLHSSADFVDHHKANAKRLDLSRIFHGAKGTVSFHVVGSTEDPFEAQQAKLAKARLGADGLDVRFLKGGHLSTSERPDTLAEIIREVIAKSRGVQAAQRRDVNNSNNVGTG